METLKHPACTVGWVARLCRSCLSPGKTTRISHGRDFSPRNNSQCRLSYVVCTPPCAITCINICVHVKDHVVHVRVRWIMETLKHPACTEGWVARLCDSWFSPRKSNPNFPWEKSHWDNTVVVKKKRKKKGSADKRSQKPKCVTKGAIDNAIFR